MTHTTILLAPISYMPVTETCQRERALRISAHHITGENGKVGMCCHLGARHE